MTLERQNFNISSKVTRILNVILVAFLLIIIRIWHLSVIQYDQKLEESQKPQRRTILEPSKRGTIRDRFNIPLALNKIQYNAALVYAPLRQIPTVVWVKTPEGKKIKKFKRREYISKLAARLAQELQLDPNRIEDLIHAKASLYYNIPFTIKEQLSEKEYYRLKMMEREWIGIQVQRIPRRHYPKGRMGADIVGYMGAISRQEYEAILEEIQTLEIYLKECDEGVSPELPGGVLTNEQAEKRLQELREHAYTISDYVGKSGVEGSFEQNLRGYHGKKVYYSDARGNFLRPMAGSREPLSGQRLVLTISSELQEFAEQLLAQNEKIRAPRANSIDNAKKVITGLREPWIKGGSILALDPKTGEILAMASYPRYNPNDFIAAGNAEENKRKRMNIGKWFESDTYIGEIWDMKRPLERELFNDDSEVFYDEKLWMTWDNYLYFILPQDSAVRKGLAQVKTIARAIELQQHVETLLTLSGQENAYALFNALFEGEHHKSHGPKLTLESKKRLEDNQKEVSRLKNKLEGYFVDMPQNYDKILLVDLCRVVVRGDRFSPSLIVRVGDRTLSAYRDVNAAYVTVKEVVRRMAKELFHEQDFNMWRQENEKAYLKIKRLEEKAAKKYAKPYIDILDAKEAELFQDFWEQHGNHFVIAFEKGIASPNPSLKLYMRHFVKWHEELEQGAHPETPWRVAYTTLSNSLGGMDSVTAREFLNTMRSYHELDRPLLGRYRYLRKQGAKQFEKHLAAAFYPINGFSYCRSQAYRQAAPQGSIFKMVTAYAALMQRYQECKDKNLTMQKLNPLVIIDQNYRQGNEVYVGYLADGTPLPRSYKGGRLPRSAGQKGHLDLIKAIEVSSNPYFALLAGDILKSPEDLLVAARAMSFGSKTDFDLNGELSGKLPDDISHNRTGLYSTAIGQHTMVVTPLQTGVMLSALANGGNILKPQILKLSATKEGVKKVPVVVQREIFMPAIVRKILLEGMRRVVVKTQEDSIRSLSRIYKNHPEAISDYLDLREELIGKTSTAEMVENLDLDLLRGTNMYTHVWFGGISFNQNVLNQDKFGEPELVVVIYLKYGAYGKEAAPMAAQIVQKWREIKASKRESGVERQE